MTGSNVSSRPGRGLLDPGPGLELAVATPAAWAPHAVGDDHTVLREQAHLERKAAAAAMRFQFVLPDRTDYQRVLSRLAREELVHFEQALKLLLARGGTFGPQVPGRYAARLKEIVRKPERERLLDELLLAAVIEARSCERMGCVADALLERDPEVAAFLLRLVEAEKRHRVGYLQLAATEFGAEPVQLRWPALAAHEAEVLQQLEPGPGLHSGIAGLVAGAAGG